MSKYFERSKKTLVVLTPRLPRPLQKKIFDYLTTDTKAKLMKMYPTLVVDKVEKCIRKSFLFCSNLEEALDEEKCG
jgi:hypothetical protein